jgi:hypothetical protein
MQNRITQIADHQRSTTTTTKRRQSKDGFTLSRSGARTQSPPRRASARGVSHECLIAGRNTGRSTGHKRTSSYSDSSVNIHAYGAMVPFHNKKLTFDREGLPLKDVVTERPCVFGCSAQPTPRDRIRMIHFDRSSFDALTIKLESTAGFREFQ